MDEQRPKPKTSPRRRKPRSIASATAAPPPEDKRYRVEGLARRGRIMHVNVTGQPGLWRFYGPAGFLGEVRANTVQDALRKGRRLLPLRPIVVREV